jgi:hypothetical protein
MKHNQRGIKRQLRFAMRTKPMLTFLRPSRRFVMILAVGTCFTVWTPTRRSMRQPVRAFRRRAGPLAMSLYGSKVNPLRSSGRCRLLSVGNRAQPPAVPQRPSPSWLVPMRRCDRRAGRTHAYPPCSRPVAWPAVSNRACSRAGHAACAAPCAAPRIQGGPGTTAHLFTRLSWRTTRPRTKVSVYDGRSNLSVGRR